MSLRRRILILGTIALIGLLGSLYATARSIFLNSILALEQREAQQHAALVLQALSDDLGTLNATAGDYAGWDDTYAFIQDRNDSYVRSNLVDATFVQNRLNLIMLVDPSGSLVYGQGYDLQARKGEPVPEELRPGSAAYARLLQHAGPESRISGLVLLADGPMLVSSWPILTSAFEGPVRGALIMGRSLDTAEIGRLSTSTCLPLSVQWLDDPQLPPAVVAHRFTPDVPILARPLDGLTIASYAMVQDLFGRPALLLRADMPREIYLRGLATIYALIAVLLFLGIAFGVTGLGFLDRAVLRPLANLSDGVNRISVSGDLSTRVPASGNDELARLSRAINALLKATQDSAQALQESEGRLRTIIDSAQVGLVIIDAETHLIADANRIALEMLGATPEETVGSSCHKLICPAKEGCCPVTDLGQPVSNAERVLLRADGQLLPVVMTAVPVLLGGRRCLLESFIDISERKRLEGQLLRAQKMETVGRLAGGIAHDFNNLLTAITGYANLARGALPDDSPAREDLEQVIKATARAANLTRQLLTFSRRQMIAPQAINLNELILDMDRLLRRLIGEDIELVTIPGAELSTVRADPGQMEQVLVNLVVNARDAMPGGGKLTIETANVSIDQEHMRRHIDATPGAFVMLAVTDTGTGMTDEVKAHLFEPFFTTKEPGKGTGLGLATVYGIVKQHHGTIWVYSEPGQGTTVKVYLPRAEERPPEIAPADEDPAGLAQGRTVLLVEDDTAVRELAARTLRRMGYTVFEAASGPEALDLAARLADRPIHLLLTDIVMPQMGGQEVSRRLRATRPGLKALFISGYADQAVVQNGILDEGTAFLQKPFTVAALARKVRQVLESG